MRAAMIAILLVGCGGCGGSQASSAGEPSPPSTDTILVESAPRTEPETGEPARDPGPPPVLAVRGTPDHRGEVALAIENRGTTTTSIAAAIRIETQRGDAWEPLEGTAITARPDCTHEAPACQELAPGAALVPPPWRGTLGDAQCACERCVTAPAGTYRLVARTCDGAHTIAGDPFELAR